MKMFFVFIICGLIFSVNFSSEAKIKNIQDDSSSKEASSNADVIKKSDLESLYQLKWQYMVKNYIEKLESYLSIRFVPKWSLVDYYHSPDRQIIEIRRQRWEYILEKSVDSLLIKRLYSELEKAEMNTTTFCKDMAEIYFTLSDNDYLFDKRSNSSKEQNLFVFVDSSTRAKTMSIFMNSISSCKMDIINENEVPESTHVNSLCHDAYFAAMKKYYEDKIEIVKDRYKAKVRNARDQSGYPNSDLSSD